jgi:putative chitinase
MDPVLFAAALTRLWPHGDAHIPGLRAGIIAQAPPLFEKYGLTSAMPIANAFGEFTEECGGGLEVEENLNYRASVLHAQWPIHFTIGAGLGHAAPAAANRQPGL